MNWTVIVSDFAEKQFKNLDRPIQKRIADYLYIRLEGCKDPRHFGEPLSGDKSGLWRYRVGDYRIVCEIQDEKLIIIALNIGHRRNIYK